MQPAVHRQQVLDATKTDAATREPLNHPALRDIGLPEHPGPVLPEPLQFDDPRPLPVPQRLLVQPELPGGFLDRVDHVGIHQVRGVAPWLP